MSVKIKKVAKALPAYTRTTAEVIPFLETWLTGQDDRFIRKVKKIFENAGVDRRYSILSPQDVFSKMPFDERNRIYSKEMVKLGKTCLEKALKEADWNPTDLDYIITVSCTGIMIPAVDAYLINELQLRQDIIRLPVTEMGCAGGVAGMIYAKAFLQAHPGKRAAVLALESPMATFQLDDFSMANVVSAAIFGDGAACVLLSSNERDEGPELVDEGMYHFYDSTQLMGFDLTRSGLTNGTGY